MLITKLEKVSREYDLLAYSYFKAGKTPAEVIEVLKASGYKVTLNGATYSVDAITIANIVRGIYLGIKLAGESPAKPVKKVAKAPKPKHTPSYEIVDDEVPF